MSLSDPRQDGDTADDTEHWVEVLQGTRPASTPEEAHVASLRRLLAVVPADAPSNVLTPQHREALLAALEQARVSTPVGALAAAQATHTQAQDVRTDPLAMIRWDWRWLLGGRPGTAAWGAAAVAAVVVVAVVLALVGSEGDPRGAGWAERRDAGAATAGAPADPRAAPVNDPPVTGPNGLPPDASGTVVVSAANPQALAARLWTLLADAQLQVTMERVEAQVVVSATVPASQQAATQQILLGEGIRWNRQSKLSVAIRPTASGAGR